MTKICSKCKKLLPLEDFHKDKIRRDGRMFSCKKCVNSLHKFHYTINRTKLCEKSRMNRACLKLCDEKTRKLKSMRVLLSKIKSRAKKRNLDFELDFDWVIHNIPENCPVLGIKLTFLESNLQALDSAASFDRIDNLHGYTKDNTIIISKRANQLKNSASISELLKISEFYKKYLKESKADEDIIYN